MPSILKKALFLLTGDDVSLDFLKTPPKKRPLRTLTERELLTLESEIGGQLFGPVPDGYRREFFCLDRDTWIWYEEGVDKDNKKQTTTIRYEVSPTQVLKIQEGGRYSYVEGDELRNFGLAVRLYYEQVARKVYRRDPATGHKLQAG
ncbi:MAG TPA: hypothetical protein PL191_02230 [Candidatus Saccharimonas sp.]|jgi:hypothetical protein|nr:hypothetical protein [Candidatus Saccharibacteria bacterium]HPQ82537.1 hypothetical protein [Candidatus Saccharimonas sp.]